MEVEFAESFTKIRLEWLENLAVAINLPAQSICNHIGLAWSIFNTWIVLLNHFDPSSLPEVEVGLSEDILEALVIGENVHLPSQ